MPAFLHPGGLVVLMNLHWCSIFFLPGATASLGVNDEEAACCMMMRRVVAALQASTALWRCELK